MAKIKLPKSELPFLKADLELDETTLRKLQSLQQEFKVKFDENIKATGKEALARYELKIKNLTEARDKILRQYDAEIKEYQALVREMKGETTPKEKPTNMTKKNGS